MSPKLALIITKQKLSFRTIAWVLTKWRYALLALVIAFLFFELIYWMFNLSILFTILGSGNVSITEKASVLISPIQSIMSVSGGFIVSLMLALSVLQGANIAVLIFTMRHQQKTDPSLLGSSTLVSLLALIGLGCPACGTSLITPVVALFVSTSAVAVSEKITLIVLPFAIIVGLYGIYVLGLRASSIKAQHQLDKESSNNDISAL